MHPIRKFLLLFAFGNLSIGVIALYLWIFASKKWLNVNQIIALAMVAFVSTIIAIMLDNDQ